MTETNNYESIRHSGWNDDGQYNNLNVFLSDSTAAFIQSKLCSYFGGKVIVPLDKIIHLMNGVYDGYRPSTGDIFTRYNVKSNENYNAVDELINQTLKIAYDTIRDDFDTRYQNSQLSIWTSVLGEFNEHGLRSHAPIKLKRRRVPSTFINMNF